MAGSEKKDKTIIFREFAEKAKKRIEERKKLKTKQFYVKDADVTLTLHGLTEEEVSECSDMYESALENDKYMIYLACRELQETSAILVKERVLKENERYKITDMFSPADRTVLAKELLALSGFGGESSIEAVNETDEIKN